MSYSEELYNKIVAEPALTNESTYDEFLANIEDPEQLKNVYFKAKYFDPYNTPSTIEEFSELLKKKDEVDFGGLSQPSEQDTMPTEETTSQIPTVGTNLIDPNSPLKANISVPLAAVGVNKINNASINQEEQLGVEAQNQVKTAPQPEMQAPQFQELNLIQKAKSVANNFKNTYLSPLAQADADVDRDMEEVEDEGNLDKRKPKKKATRGDVKNAANELLTTEGKIDAVNRRTYEDAKTALGKLNVYGIKVDGDKYQMIYTHPDRATDIGVIYDGTVGDASWKGYVESRYQAGGIPTYNDDESWQDLKEAVVDIDGYDISNLRGDSNQNSLNVNLTSHKRKYGFEEGVGVSIPSLEIKRDKDEEGKNKQGFFRDKLERVLYTAKTQIQLTEKAKQEAKEFQTTKDIETATMYIPEAESNFFEDIYNNPTTNEVGKALEGIVTPAKLMFGADKDYIKDQIKYYLIQNGQKDLSGESYSVGENYQPTMEEQLKGRFSLQQSVDMIYNNMVRDAQFHFGRAYIEREGLRGNQELGKKQTLEKLNYIQKNSLDTKTDRSDDPAELALMDFGIQIFDAAKNDYKSHYEAKAGILTKTSQYKGTSGRINALNARILDISKEIEGLQSKYKLPSEEESKNIQARISDRKKKLDELAKERDALLVDVEGEYFKDETSSARGAEIEKEMQSLTVTENGQTFWKDEASQKRGEELQKELAGLVEKKKGKGYKDKDAEAKYNELESQMQTLIDEISQDDALLDPARKFSEEVTSKVEKARRLEAKMKGIASSSEELNTLKGLQDQLDAIDQYNSMGGRTELDGFSRRRKDVEYEQANLKREGENDNAVEAFTKGMFGGIASTVLGATLTAAYLNPATGFLTESDETFDSADMAKLAIGQMIKDVSQFQRNPYYKDWSLNSISAGVGGVVPDLIGVALTGGGSGIASLAGKYGLRKAVGKIATSPTTLYFTMRSTGERALMYENAGYSPAEALAFGAAVSHVEAMLESLIPEFGSSSQRIAIKSAFGEIVEQGIKNGVSVEEIAKQLTSSFFASAGKFGYKITEQGVKEGVVEEGTQGLFGGTADALITGEDASLYNFSTGEITEKGNELLFGTAVGGIVGVGMQSVQSYKDWVSSAPNRESVKLVQLTIGKDYKGIYDAVIKENKDLKDNEVLKHYEKISQTYNELSNNPTFKNSGDLEKSEILDRTLALDDLLKSQKELASKGIVDKNLDLDIEAKQKELSEILDVSASHTEQRKELNEKLKSLGVEGYSIGSDNTVNNIKVSPQIPQDQVESVVKQATEIIETTYKPKEDAVQESEAGQVPVQPEAAVGQQMEEGVSQAEPQVTTKEGGQPKIEPHEMGEFDEKYMGIDDGLMVDEGYLKNNFWASPIKQISSAFKYLFSEKKTKEKGVSAYIFKPKSAPKRTSETQLNYNTILNSADEIIEMYQDGNGKNDERIINNAKKAGLTDELINQIIEIKNSIPESADKKERAKNGKKAFAQAENVIGEFMVSQGVESSDAYRGAEEETRQEGDLPKQYRFFGNKGNAMLGAVDITPELAERLSDETLSEEERGRIISEAAGIEYDPDAFVHINTTKVADYAKKNNIKLQGETKVEGQENVEEESLSDEEWNDMVSEAESLGSDIEQVSQNVKQDTRKSKIVQQIKKGAKSLSSIFPNMKIVVHENNASYNKAMDVLGGRKNTRGQFVYMPTSDGNYTGAIHINLERANGRTVPHEIAHAVMLKLFGENAEVFKNFRDKIKDLAKGRTVKLKDAEGNVEEVSWDDLASDLADRYEDNERGEEYLAELTGIMNDIDLDDKESRNIFQKVADFINNFISRFTGLKAIDDTSSAEDVLEFFETLGKKISRGENIDYQNEIDNTNTNALIGTAVVNGEVKAQSQIDSELHPLQSRTDNFQKVQTIKLSELNNKTGVLTQSDRLLTGVLVFPDGTSMTLKGGIFYPSETGLVWAATDLQTSTPLVKQLNQTIAEQGEAWLFPFNNAYGSQSSNYTFFEVAMRHLQAAVKKRDVTKDDVINKLNKFKQRKNYQDSFKKGYKPKVFSQSLSGKTLQQIYDMMHEDFLPENATYPGRTEFINTFFGGKETKGRVFKNIPNTAELIEITTEPVNRDVRDYTVSSVIKITGNVTTRETTVEKDGELFHSSYPAIVETDGEVESYVLDGTYPVEEIFPSFTNAAGEVVTWEGVKKSFEEKGQEATYKNYKNKFSSAQGSIPRSSKIVAKSQLSEDEIASMSKEEQSELLKDTPALNIDGQTIFYHASDKPRKGRLKMRFAEGWGDGVYFATDKDAVQYSFGDNITEVALNPSNPVTYGTKEFQKLEDLATEKAGRDSYDFDEIDRNYITKAAKELGIDAIISSGQYGMEVVVLDESKIIYDDEIPSFISKQSKGPRVKAQIDIDAKDSPLYKKRNKEDMNFISNERVEKAILNNQVPSDQVKRYKNAKPLQEGEIVGARLNLNGTAQAGFEIMSIHEGLRAKGKVKTYRGNVTLKNVQFTVEQGAREAIVTGKRLKEPMAVAAGEYTTKEANFDGIEVKFNPKKLHLFVDSEGRAIKSAEEVTIMGHRAYARGKITYYEEFEDPRNEKYTAPSEVKFAKTKEELIGIAEDLRSGEIVPEDLGVTDVSPEELADTLDAVAETIEENKDVVETVKSIPNKKTKDDVETVMAKIIAANVKSRMDVGDKSQDEVMKLALIDYLKSEGAKGNLSEAADSMMRNYPTLMAKVSQEVVNQSKREKAKTRSEMTPEQKQLEATIKREAKAALEGYTQGKKEGKAEGVEKGKEAGRKEGFKEGQKEGKAEGKEMGRKEGVVAGRKVGFFEGIFRGAAKAESAQRNVAKAVRDVINEFKKTNKISDAVARQLVKRAVGITTENELADYMNFVSEVLMNNEIATALSEIKKLQKQALKKRTYQYYTTIRQFAKMPLFKDRNLLFDYETLEQYLDALRKIVDGKVPDISGMNSLHSSGTSLINFMNNVAQLNKKGFDINKAQEVVKDILNDLYFKNIKINNVDDFRNFKRQVSRLRNNLGQLLAKGVITQTEYDDAMGKLVDLDATYTTYSDYYQDQIDAIKNQLIKDIFDGQIKDVVDFMNSNPDVFTDPQKELIRKLAGMNPQALSEVLDIEDADSLREVVESMEDGFVDEAALRRILSKAEIRGNKVGEKINAQLAGIRSRYKKGDVGLKLFRDLMTKAVVFWESQLGLSEKGAFWNYVSQPITRAINQWNKLYDESIRQFMSDVKGISFKGTTEVYDPVSQKYVKVSNETYSRIKIGLIGHILDNAWKKVNSPQTKEDMMGDWLGDILNNKAIAINFQKGGDYNMAVVMDIYKKLAGAYSNDNGGINHEALLAAYEKGGRSRDNILSKEEQEYYNALRRQFETTSEYVIAANSMRQQNSETNPYYMPRSYFADTRNKRVSSDVNKEVSGKAGQRASASYERVAGVPYEALEFNVDKLLNTHLEEVYRDYSLTEAKVFVNEVFANARDNAKTEDEVILLDQLQELAKGRIEFALEDAANLGMLSSVTKLFVTNTLIGVKRTPVEFLNNLIVYSTGNRSSKSVTLPFNKKELDETDELLKRFNSSIYADAPKRQIVLGKRVMEKLKSGKMDAKLKQEAAINLIYPYLNNTTSWMRKGEWKSNFDRAFQELTGEKFSFSKHYNDPKYNEAMSEAANAADFNMRRIMKGGNKSEQAQYVKLAPEWMYKMFGNRRKEKGMVSVNSYGSMFLTLYTGFIGHDVTNIEEGFRKTVTGKEIKDGLKQMGGAAFRLSLYPTLMVVADALLKAYFGDDDEKKEGEETLKSLTTPEGYSDLFKTLASQMASSYVSGKYGNLAKLVGSFALDAAYSYGDDNQKKMIKTIMRELYFTDPMDWKQSSQAAKDYIYRASSILAPMVGMIAKEVEETIEDLQDKSPYEKVTVGDIIEYFTKDEEGASAWQLFTGVLMLGQGLMSAAGTPIPFVDDFVRMFDDSVKNQEVNDRDMRVTFTTESGQLIDMNDLLLNDKGMVDFNISGLTTEQREELSELATEKYQEMLDNRFGILTDEQKQNAKMNVPKFQSSFKSQYNTLQGFLDKAKFEAMKELGYNVQEYDVKEERYMDKPLTDYNAPSHKDDLIDDILKGKHLTSSQHRSEKADMDKYVQQEFEKYDKKDKLTPGGMNALREYYKAKYINEKYKLGKEPREYDYLKQYGDKIIERPEKVSDAEIEKLKEENKEYRENKE